MNAAGLPVTLWLSQPPQPAGLTHKVTLATIEHLIDIRGSVVLKVNPVSQSTVAGGSDAGSRNLSLITSSAPGQMPTNAGKSNDGRLAVRVRSEARTGAAAQIRDGHRASPTALPLPNQKAGIPVRTPLIEPDWKIDPARASRVTTPEQMELDQTAAAVMARTNFIAESLNAVVKRFYQEACGGVAARSSRVMDGALREVAQYKNQLADVIKASASFVAANSAEFPALSKWRQRLINSHRSIDIWLKNANAYAAGLSRPGPGGQKTSTPTLVRPPSVLLSSSVSPRSVTQEANDIRKEYDRANKVITRTNHSATLNRPGV